MNESLFHTLLIAGFAGLIGIRLAAWRIVIQKGGQKDLHESKLTMAVRAISGLGYLALLLIYLFTPATFQWAGVTLAGWLRWLGFFIMAASLLGLAWVQWALGQNFHTTLHARQEHALVTYGPYRWIRHPMYTMLVLLGLGMFLLSANWLVGAPLIVGLAIIVGTRIKHEEALMLDMFGDQYRRYMHHTGRFLPRIWRAG